MRRNNDYFEIHGLIQKVVQFYIQINRFVDGSNPRELLVNILTSISSSVDSHDICYNDNENLWFVHFIKLIQIVDDPDFDLLRRFNVTLLTKIANRRYDWNALYEICYKFIPFLLEKFNRTKNFDDLFLLLDFYRIFLTFNIVDNSFVERMIQFQQEFEKELAIEHRSIFLWKIQLSKFFQENKNLQRAEAISFELFEQLINKEGFRRRKT